MRFLKRLRQLLTWLKGLPCDQRWRLSSAIGTIKWIIGLALVYFLVSRIGHKWQVNAAVAAALDSLLYLGNRVLWKDRSAGDGNSASTTAVVSLSLFAFNNFCIMWLLLDIWEMGVTTAKLAALPVGLALNPITYAINDKIAFQPEGLRRLLRRPRVV